MASKNRIGRREFIATSGGVLAAGLGSACGRVPMSEIEAAAAKVGPPAATPLGPLRPQG